MRRQEDRFAADRERLPERHTGAHSLRLCLRRAIEHGFSLVGRFADDERAAVERGVALSLHRDGEVRDEDAGDSHG